MNARPLICVVEQLAVLSVQTVSGQITQLNFATLALATAKPAGVLPIAIATHAILQAKWLTLESALASVPTECIKTQMEPARTVTLGAQPARPTELPSAQPVTLGTS